MNCEGRINKTGARFSQKAGLFWILAFAGMTNYMEFRLFTNSSTFKF